MQDEPRLLVVDDEEAICEGCRRIFSRQGFQVEKSVDAQEGLAMAVDRDYAAVLLDIKMPNMDGIQFLEQLRAKKPDLPVILMTGYPSIPNSVSAIRLGASGYVTKPFTPEEISQAVQKYIRKGTAAEGEAGSSASERWSPAAEGVAFWHEAWFHAGGDGTARVGVMLPRPQAAVVKGIRFPGIGEVVYQGLPLASLTLADDSQVIVPAPISGLVLGVNDALNQGAAALATDPCGRGWIATLSPTRLEEEAKNTTRRKVVLFHADAAAAKAEQEKLASLGCHVRLATKWDEVRSAIDTNDYSVVVMDSSRFGDEGPSLVGQINSAAPAVKVVLVASEGCTREAAYRTHRIFYYAVEPFADNEIAEILEAAFRCSPQNGVQPERRKAPAGALCSILITNRNGQKVRLVVAPNLLRREDGLGATLRHKLLDRLFPMETVSGDANLDPSNVLKLAEACDRLVVLMAKDLGRLPGSLIRDTKAEFVSVSGDGAGKVTILAVQPAVDGGIDSFDPRTAAALADQIIQDMASY
jgi:DNA-binding response OmpR family regulator/glycine cleavage system H lipoate-binding protein